MSVESREATEVEGGYVFGWRHGIVARRMRDVPWGRCLIAGLAFMLVASPLLMLSSAPPVRVLLLFGLGVLFWTGFFMTATWWHIRKRGEEVFPPAPWLRRWDDFVAERRR